MDQATSQFIIAVSLSLLTLLSTIAGILLWSMLRTMQGEIRESQIINGKHETTLQLHEQLHGGYNARFKELRVDHGSLAKAVASEVLIGLNKGG